MKRNFSRLIGLGALGLASGLAACTTVPDDSAGVKPAPETALSQCPVIASRGWKAWVNAMPGPGAVRTLHIEGEIDLPTPGFKTVLVPGPSDRMMPPAQRFALDASPPGGMTAQVVTPTSVNYQGPAVHEKYRAIMIGCGGKELARIENIETVY